MTFSFMLGKVAASAGRSTAASVPNTKRATVMTAPVLPVLTSASAWPSLHQPGGDMHRTFLLAPEGVRRRIGHGDHFGGVDDFDGQAAETVTIQLLLDGGFDAHEQYADAQLTRRENRAFDFRARGMVATHGIQSDGGHLYTTRNQTVTSSGKVSEGNLGCLA